MDPATLKLIYWGSLAILGYTFAGYAMGMALLARLCPGPAAKGSPATPPLLSVIVVAHNEELRIGPRVRNLLAAEYPPQQMEILVVSDGSTDATVERVRDISDARVRLLDCPQRAGKAAGLNTAVAAARGEIIVFTDARQEFPPDAIRHLAANFSDPRIGAVSGSLEIAPANTGTGGGVDVYWRMEKFLRHTESLWDSAIGCTGAIYAIRRKLYAPIPEGTFLDDVVIPMQIAVQGWRVGFDPQAVAFDPQASDPARERLRKQRTLAGNFQMLFRHPEWLLPWRNRLWWQLLSHKYLRLAAPAFLLLALAANIPLGGELFYRWLLVAQGVFYGLALAGVICPKLKFRGFSIPAGFVFLNWMTVRGFFYYLRPPRRSGWDAAQPSSCSNPPPS